MLYYLFWPIITVFYWLIFRPKVLNRKALRLRGKVVATICNGKVVHDIMSEYE